jgi:hypothetical protein
MKKYLLLMLLSTSLYTAAYAQDYKVNRTSGKVTLDLASVEIEGYNGNEIIFSSTREKPETDPRAQGLRAINGAGYTDNTGLGISVTNSGSTTEVHQVTGSVSVKVRVPRGILISLACHRLSGAGKIAFRNLSNEIEIATDYNTIVLENVTGPLSVRALYGSVEAKFAGVVKGPIAIASVYSTVDVSLPGSTKANIRLSSSHGEIMAAADLNMVLEKNASSDMITYGNTVNGKLNGGGADIKLTSEYAKIYLRSSK